MKNSTYCNPLPLPDLGRGITCREKNSSAESFLPGYRVDFRESADPEVLWHDGKYYLYPSVCQVYVSENLLDWEYSPLRIEGELGYAPTAIYFRNRFLLTSSPRNGQAMIYSAPTPLGPFVPLGSPRKADGKEISSDFLDPAFFADEGRLYLFWGCAPFGGGIYGAEVNPDEPCQLLGEPVKVIDFDTSNLWEHFGEYNEHLHYGWNEGISVIRHNGTYLLEYACCGTQFRNYALACWRSEISPLGPFIPPTRPMALSRYGIVTGTGHGGFVHTPDGTLWQFYTCRLHRLHKFERRIGMDRVEFDASGEPYVKITSTPQTLSGETGWVPVSVGKRTEFSSCQNDHFGAFSVDECTHTWWEPADHDPQPSLTVDLAQSFDLRAARIIWTEPDLDYERGNEPEPVRFRIEFLDAGKKILPDAAIVSDDPVDRNICYIEFEKVFHARYARLVICRDKNRYRHGVVDFTLFAPRGGD